ncbi:MAG TPA: hypothetical protein VFL41_13145, partial [Gaiellaceae bacterium]|nr:hypothetical protein [Gaiellaceae bacterium]
NWRIPGRAAGKPFAIEGFLGYVPPAERSDDQDGGVSLAWLMVALASLIAVAGAGIYVVERRRP